MSCARRRYRSSALTALSRTSLSLDASAWPNLGVGPERAASSGRGRDEVGEAFAGAFFLPIPCVRRVRHVADVFARSTRAGTNLAARVDAERRNGLRYRGEQNEGKYICKTSGQVVDKFRQTRYCT